MRWAPAKAVRRLGASAQFLRTEEENRARGGRGRVAAGLGRRRRQGEAGGGGTTENLGFFFLSFLVNREGRVGRRV